MKGIEGLSELRLLSSGDPGIKIAILDGPVDLQHPCFNVSDGNLVPFHTDQVNPSASMGLALRHGTAICSLIFGKPGTNVEGVAPGCSGLIIPIYSQNENGNFSSVSQAHLAKSIKTAVEQGANIINISGGQFSKYGEPEFLLKQAIEDCYKAGILIVAAAGNEGCSCLHVPAANRQVIAVGSMDENGSPTPETNFGEHYQINGILAPGKNLTAALAGGGTFITSGATSYATPLVSGIVGLLMSLQIQRGHQPDAYAIKSILENTAIPCPGDEGIDCKRFLRGKLNLPAAIAAIQEQPGVLASGMGPEHEIKITAMDTDTEIGTPATEHIQAFQPSANNKETIILEEDIDSMNKNAVMPAEGLSKITDLSLSRDGPYIDVEESAVNVSENTKSLNILNNLNIQKMEKETQNQTAMTSLTSEPVVERLVITPSGDIEPSDCGCGGAKQSTNGDDGGNGNTAASSTLVYALGTIGYDFGSEAHQDSFVQSMGGENPHNPAAIIKYIKANPWTAEELVWTLNIDATPIYAIFPTGPHSQYGYERLRQYLEQQVNGNIQRISVPGFSQGSTRLLNGYTVPNLFPNLRGMYSWTTEALTAAATGSKGSAKALAENVTNFLNRIYYQMRNLGVSPEERALNYAATNAYQVSAVFGAALKENLELNDITAEKSPICRPGSDCYDVKLSFFNPKERLTQARKEYRFTVDVSDVVPVTVGEVKAWSVY
jgi:cyanobactin maturation PatA/PatG family protease